jgi:hypothetical protein
MNGIHQSNPVQKLFFVHVKKALDKLKKGGYIGINTG